MVFKIFKITKNMSQNLQEIFNKIQETKKDQKSIKSIYREALEKSQPYHDVLEKLAALKEEKKKIESTIKDEYKSELARLDAIKTDLESDKILMSDLAVNEIVKGNVIEITDQYSNKYEPIISVRFKKIG